MSFISPHYNKKTVAALLILMLLGTDLVGPGSRLAHAAQPVSGAQTSVDLNDLELPAAMGSVESVTTFRSSPFNVVILQDAHAIPSAQKSLFELTRWFQSHRNADVVLLEGGAGDLDPLLLKSFPDTERLGKVLMSYLETGEISGAAAAAVMKDSTAAFSGIEDEELYRASVNAYLDALRQAPGLEKLLAKMKEELRSETDAEGGLLADAVKLLEGRLTFTDQLLFLNGLVTDQFRGRYADRFSDVFLLLQSLKKNELSGNALRSEMSELAEVFAQSGLSDEDRKEAVLWKQQFQTEILSPEDYASKIMEAASRRGLEIKVSAQLAAAAALKKRFDTLNATVFSRQWQEFQETLLNSALGSRSEVFQAWKLLLLLQRWLRLELSPEDWTALQSRDVFTQSKAAESGWNEKLLLVRASAGVDNPWDRFYRLAAERDHVFSSVLQELARREQPPQLVLLAAGGFHTEGLERKLSAMGLSHARILPSVETIPDEAGYRDFMSGKVSWKQHFRKRGGQVDVYEAFQQSAASRIADSLKDDPGHFAALFTLWREEVIRALARENRLGEAGAYTSFIDRARFSKLPESQRSVFEQNWNRELSGFLNNMRLLRDENRLSGEAISGLPARSGVVQWPAVMGFVRGARVPENWTEGLAEGAAAAAAGGSFEAAVLPGRSELRAEGDEEDKREGNGERSEILFEDPLKTSWKVFWFSAPAVFAAMLAVVRVQAAGQVSWPESIASAVLLTGVYILGVGSMLLNTERKVLRQLMNDRMVPAPRYHSVPLEDDLMRTTIDVPELFRAEPGDRLPVEKFVSTALHALELIPSQVIRISIGIQTIYERGEYVPELSDIMEAAEAFDFGSRPAHLGPISLQLTIVHGPATRSELRADTGVQDESGESPRFTNPPVLTAEISLERFRSILLDADFTGASEEDRKVRISGLNEEVRRALNGLVYRDGYQLVWNTMDYSLIRLSDQKTAGNISVELVARGSELAVDISYHLVRDAGKGLLSDFHTFLAKALPRHIPLTSVIDNVPTLLKLLDLLNRDGAGVLSADESSEVRKVREEYSEAIQTDFYLPASGEWRARVRALLVRFYYAYPQLIPDSRILIQTQTGHLNRYYGNADTQLIYDNGFLSFTAFQKPAGWSLLESQPDLKERFQLLRMKINRELDAAPYFAVRKASERLKSYTSFVRDFSLRSGVSRIVERKGVSSRSFYSENFAELRGHISEFRQMLKQPVSLKKMSGQLTIIATAALNLLFVGVTVPSAVPDYDAQRELESITLTSRLQFHFPGLYLTLFAAGVVTGGGSLYEGLGMLAFVVAGLNLLLRPFLALMFGASVGHEYTHVLQMSLIHRIRDELDLPITYKEAFQLFSVSDYEAYPLTVLQKNTPDRKQLEILAERFFNRFEEKLADFEQLRDAALPHREVWESEKRVNAPNTYYKHQVLLNDVIEGVRKKILKHVVLVDAAGIESSLFSRSVPDMPAVINKRLLEFRRAGGYSYRWSWAHQRLTVQATQQVEMGARSEMRAFAADEDEELGEFPEKVRYRNGVHQAFFNRAVSLLVRARRDQHIPGADLQLLEEAESKIQMALQLMKRIRGRAVLPAYLKRRAFLERNLGNLLASNFIRRSILLRDGGDLIGARELVARALEQLELIESAGMSDRVTRWTRSQALRQSAYIDARAARIQRASGLYETSLELYQKAWRSYAAALALLEAGDDEERQRTELERGLLNREIDAVVESQDEVRASLRSLIRGSAVELRLMGSDFSSDEPYFLAGLKEPYPVLGRGEKMQLFSEWTFFERYAEKDGVIRWDEDNDVMVAYLGGQPAAAWAFQAELTDLSVRGNGLYVSPVLRDSGLGIFLARRLFLMLKNQGFKTFHIGPEYAHPSWGIDKTPEAQAFHRSLISRLGKNAVSKIVYYADGQIQGVTIDLRRVQFSSRSELRVTEETLPEQDPWSVFWKDAAHLTSFTEGNLKHSYYQGEMARVLDSVVEELSAGGRVLDIASGNGAAAMALSEAAAASGKPLQIMSIDQADTAGLSDRRGQVEFTKMKAEKLAFPDRLFDSVISFFGFEFTDRTRSLPELLRVLKPGARTVLVLHAAESSLINFYRETGSLYDEFAPELLKAARFYAGAPEGEGGMAWFNAMSKVLETLTARDPKPGPMKAMVNMMTELERLLSLDEGAPENPSARLKSFDEWEERFLNVRSVMAQSVESAMSFAQARQLVRDSEQLGFDDVYVQPFMFQSQHLGWIFHATNPKPPETEVSAAGVPADDRDKIPPGYVMHEIGNLLAGLLLSDILLDPHERGLLGSFYGDEFAAEYQNLKKRFHTLRSSVHVIKKVRIESFMQEMRSFFSEEKIAPVIERILASGHPSSAAAAKNFENSSRWLYQLLDVFLSGGSEPLQNIRVHGLITDAAAGFGDSVYYGGSVSNTTLRVHTYPVELYRVIRNLTINAVHATDEQVTGRSRQVVLNVEPVDPALNDGYPVRVQVRDNGTGIPEDVLPKIFEPFFTTKGEKGLGVGLSMVKSLVETNLGGKLTVDTKEGEGTVFSIYLPESAPARSELRQQPGDLTRRAALQMFGGAFLSASLASAFQSVRAQPKAKDLPRKLTLPQNAYLKNPLFREVYRDTQSSLLQLRTQAGLPFNQALTAAVPAGGWMKSSDLGFLWTSDLIAALSHASAPLGDRLSFSSPASVTDRIRGSLALYKKLVDDYGLKIEGVNTGILPEVLVHERAGFRAEAVEIPGRKGERGIPYAAYDMALTHVRLKILAEVFKGGYVRGLEDKEIVKMAEELLAKADYRSFLDTDAKIRTQVFQKAGQRDVILGPSLIDNRHTEAREFFLIAELFAKPGLVKDRRKEGLKVLGKLKHEWVFTAGPGGEAVAIGKGDENLTSWTEYEGLQFLDPAALSPGILAVSSRNYFHAAEELARGLKHEFAVTTPGSGAKPDIYEPFGFKKPDVLVAAGPFLALNSDLPQAVQNAEKFIRAAKRQRSYTAGWGLADAYDPKTGRWYHTKRIYMNQALIVEALGAPFLRYVTSQMQDFAELKEEFRSFDRAHPAPADVKNANVLKLFESTGFFTQIADHPSNREFVTPKGALRIWYRLDEKNEYSGFFGKMKTQNFTPFKTLRLTFSKDSVLPDQFKIEFKDDSPEKKLIGSVDIKGAKAGTTLEVDISELAGKSPKVAEFLIVFDKTSAGKVPVGLFDLEEVQLSAVPAKPRSELRSMPEDSRTEVFDRGFYKKLDEDNELLQLVDGLSGEYLSGSAKSKAKVHQDGDWHSVAQIYLFDTAGKLLLQERSLSKDLSPGKLQVSAGGHVNAGETRTDAAVRETHEELDITLDKDRLVLLTPLNGFPRESRQGSLVNREWVTVYAYFLSDAEKAAINLNHEEISRGFFVTLPFFETLAQEHVELLSGSLQMLMSEKRDLYLGMLEQVQARMKRSELRTAELPEPLLAAVLRSVALGKSLEPGIADSVALSASQSFDQTLAAIQEAGADDAYPGLIAAETGISERGETPGLTAVQIPLTPELKIFNSRLLTVFEEDVAAALTEAPEKKMTFAFGYRLPADEQKRELVFQYLQTLARLRTAYPSQVTADIRLLVLPHETSQESVRMFIQKAGKLGVAKPVEITSGGVSAGLSGYLAEFGSALVYGLPDAAILENHTQRAVLSDVEPGDEFPVVVLLSRLLAEDGKTLLTAERLGKIAGFLPGILKMQGSTLLITRLVLEISTRFQADRLIQQAA